jgi:hypothetical protein
MIIMIGLLRAFSRFVELLGVSFFRWPFIVSLPSRPRARYHALLVAVLRGPRISLSEMKPAVLSSAPDDEAAFFGSFEGGELAIYSRTNPVFNGIAGRLYSQVIE